MSSADQQFATTHWTCILAAQGGSPAALAALRELCTAYYQPVRAFMQHSVDPQESAEDLAHEFFTRVLTGKTQLHADPQRGRFRGYLLGAVKHFLSNHRAQQRTQKHGGGRTHVSLSPGDESSNGPVVAAPDSLSPEAIFDRAWALTLLGRALEALRTRMQEKGRAQEFEVLAPWLTGEPGAPQAEAAIALDMTATAVKVAIHRLRTQFRQAVRDEISATISDPTEQAAELADLRAALAR